jgi:peptide chain release factor 2
MAATDPADEISELSSKLDTIEAVLDPEAMRTEAVDLREQAADPALWEDQTRAQQVTRRLSYLEGEMSRLENLRQRLDDTRVLFELADDEHDQSARDEAAGDLARLRKEVDLLEIRTLLNGEYDNREALITINSQAGGADAEDFAGNLQRMYLRWAERHRYPAEVFDVSYGEAGIKSTTFAVKAPYAYGTLRGEQGTHRMVRISKYDNQGRRQTSFAGVDVMPVVEQTDHVEIPDPQGPAARASTRPTRPSGSRTCRPASWCPARTSGARSRTGPQRWPCCRPSSSSAAASRRRRSSPPSRATAAAPGGRRSATTSSTRIRW